MVPCLPMSHASSRPKAKTPVRLTMGAGYSVLHIGAGPQVLGTPAPPQSPSSQLPQSIRRCAPQASKTSTRPQVAAATAQSSPSVWASQMHTLPAPQVAGSAQPPHSAIVRSTPQRSVTVIEPHSASAAAQSSASLSAAQTHWLASEQASPSPQPPQDSTVRWLPQVSVTVMEPQTAPTAAQSWASVSGLHAQIFSSVQNQPSWQVPQDSIARSSPHRSVTVSEPQTAWAAAQSCASVSPTQTQAFASQAW